MIAYLPSDITLTLNGVPVVCLQGVSISEQSDTFERKVNDIEWEDKVVNLQRWEASVAGTGAQDIATVRNLFRSKDQIIFRLEFTDGTVIISGPAIIVDFVREVAVDENDKFSARLIGVRTVGQLAESDFLILQDGDYLLQEDGSRIKN